MEQKRKLGFIGAGNMATAIISGIANSTLAESIQMASIDVDREKVQMLMQYNVQECASMKEIAETSDYIMFAVKPQNFQQILTQMKPLASKKTVYISIAAGIRADYISTLLGFTAKVVLVMPNTPLMLGEGASAISRTDNVSDDEFSFVCNLFSQSGKIAVIEQEQMNAIIPINGSSPAYIYLFAKGFIEYGKKYGINEEIALSLFSQTLIGASKMMTSSGKSIDELIKMVSSPGGATLQGLDSFYKDHFEEIVVRACEATLNRAKELGT